MFVPIAFSGRLDITVAEFYFEFRYVGMFAAGYAAVNGISALRRFNKLCKGEQNDGEK